MRTKRSTFVATTPHAAREFVVASVENLCPDAVEAARLLVSELVTNALLHAHETAVPVAVAALDRCLHVEVTDHSREVPVNRTHEDPLEPGGFGINLVDALAVRWGVQRNDDGKSVWFDLAC